jgi:hypothetical protein
MDIYPLFFICTTKLYEFKQTFTNNFYKCKFNKFSEKKLCQLKSRNLKTQFEQVYNTILTLVLQKVKQKNYAIFTRQNQIAGVLLTLQLL